MEDMERGFRIREYEARDKEEYLSLHADIFDGGSREVFEWKYEDNPFVDDVPIIVAEDPDTGNCVGFRPHLGLELRYGDWTAPVLQPCDAMVHPDYRRQGAFTEMARDAIERYTGDASLFFNFPNNQSRPGNQKLGWTNVKTIHTDTRVQDPQKWSQMKGVEELNVLAAAATPFVQGLNSLLDALPRQSDIHVNEHETLPLDLFSELSTHSHDKFHVNRTEEFYSWRYQRPGIEYDFYTSHNDGRVTAGLVAATTETDGMTSTKIVDVLPKGHSCDDTVHGWSQLLARAFTSDSDIVQLFSGEIPRRVTRKLGFWSSSDPPLSMMQNPPQLHALSLTEPDSSPAAPHSVTNPENWDLSMASWDAV